MTTLDDIAWFLNCRGTDIDYNPVFFSYLLFWPKDKRVELYVNESKTTDVAIYLKDNNVTVLPYEQISTDLSKLVSDGKKIGCDTAEANAEVIRLIGDAAVVKTQLIETMKAAKNKVEQDGIRDCHVRDQAALMRYFAWLEESLKNKDHGLNEFTAALQLEKFRSEGDKFKGLSFETISSIGPNGAVIHYAPTAT